MFKKPDWDDVSFVPWHIVLLELAVEDLKGILMKAVAFKQCSFDIKGAKVCQENIPNTITPLEPL